MFCTERCMIHLKEFVTELENIATDMKSEALLDNKKESSNNSELELNMEKILFMTNLAEKVNGKEEKKSGISENKIRSGKCFRFFYFPI